MHKEFEYDIGDRVKIIFLECKGRIKSIWITETGINYEVRYFDKAEAKTVYFYSDELEKEI